MISVKNISYKTDDRIVLENVSFSVNIGDRIGLVGRNGAGKTTLLRLLLGELKPTSGEITKKTANIKLMPQDLSAWLNKSVYNYFEEISGIKDAEAQFDRACLLLQNGTDDAALNNYAKALENYERYDMAGFATNLKKALGVAGIFGIDTSLPLDRFSGGQRTRIALAGISMAKQDVILLDEPTNNLDSQGIAILKKSISESSSAFVIVSHDRRFLKESTHRIIELLDEAGGVVQYGLGYDEYMAQRKTDKNAIKNRYEQYVIEKKRLKNAARLANVRANNGTNSGRKKAVDNDKLVANFRAEKAASGLGRAAQSLQTRTSKLQEPERPEEALSLGFIFNETDKKKLNLITASDLAVTYPNGFTVGPVSFNIRSGERYQLTGANGAGKTTLLKSIVGENQGKRTGSVAINKASNLIYIDQDQTLPLPNSTAYENIKHFAPTLAKHEIINILLNFNLKKDIITTITANELSGGERAKVLLASIAISSTNLLILDEPTNNLDLHTVEALESAIKSYNGGLLVVSHDREFLDTIGITHIIKI